MNRCRLLPSLPFLLLAVALGCGDAADLVDEGSRGMRSAAIINGSADSGHPSVGLLSSGAEYLCTATLIGRSTVLTAGHCVTKKGPGYVNYPVIFTLDSFLAPSKAVDVTVHPDFGKYYYTADLAVVKLQSPVIDVIPSRLPTKAPTKGQNVELVGFGITSSDAPISGGVKRKTQNTIAIVDALEISFHGGTGAVGNICKGDSGGPTFAQEDGQEVIIGVHSTGSVPCGSAGTDARVDAYKDWIIKAAKGDVGNDKDYHAPVVQFISPVNGDTVGADFAVKVQATDNVGVTRVEVDIEGQALSPMTAPPFDFPLKGVLPGSKIITARAFDKEKNMGQSIITVMVAPAEVKSGFGVRCVEDQDCLSGVCVSDPLSGGKFCSEPCDLANDACPAGHTCQTASGRPICLPGTAASPPAESGCTLAGQAPLPQNWPLLLLLLGFCLALVQRRRR